MAARRVGVIGCGVIGTYLVRRIAEGGFAELAFVYDADPTRTAGLPPHKVVREAGEMAARRADLVVECAHPSAVAAFAPAILPVSDFLPFSLTAFANDAFRNGMETLARASGTRIFIPHGAILGLDGIHDGRGAIDAVTITTVKSPKSLGMADFASSEPSTVYEGATRGACAKFPRNVNVHAAVALAGIGFDRTVSRIVADPGTTLMAHVIEVSGQGLRWRIEIESRPVGAVTGAYTPESVARTVRRLCEEGGGLRLA